MTAPVTGAGYDIWEGGHHITVDPDGTTHGGSIGELPLLNGGFVRVWSTSPVDVANAVMQAIGPIPSPPDFGMGGEVAVFKDETATGTNLGPPQLVYSPAGDVINQAMAQEFQAQMSAWNTRAGVIQALAAQMTGAAKTATPKVGLGFVPENAAWNHLIQRLERVQESLNTFGHLLKGLTMPATTEAKATSIATILQMLLSLFASDPEVVVGAITALMTGGFSAFLAYVEALFVAPPTPVPPGPPVPTPTMDELKAAVTKARAPTP
jgi:hypothetical protein